MNRRSSSLLAVLSLLAFAACAGDDDPASTDSTTPAADTSSPPDSTVAPTTEAIIPAAPAPTIDDLLAYDRPIVLAHTAGEDEFPASTLFAFDQSVLAGVDMLDLNVQLSKDGVLVVHHDDTVDRATNGTGLVAEMTFAELSALDDAYWFTADCGVCTDQPVESYLYRGIRTGERPPPEGYTPDDFAIPSFEQLVDRFPLLPLNVEIKGEGAPAEAAADELVRLLVDRNLVDRTVISSFDDEVVAHVHELLPEVELSPGLDASTEFVLGGTPLPFGMRILQLPPSYDGLEVITPDLVQKVADAGYVIWVWPNDRSLENLAAYTEFLEMGITGLNINFPAAGVQAVADFAG